MIQTSKEALRDTRKVQKVIERAKKEMATRQERYNRYTRKTSKNNVNVPFEYYISNIASGYFGGIAPEVAIKQETNQAKISILRKMFNKIVGKNANKDEFQIMLDYIREYNDDATVFYEWAKDYFITGACYGLVYETVDNKIVYARVPSTQACALYDYSIPTQKIGLIRIWNEEDTERVEIITDEEKLYYIKNVRQGREYKLDEDMQENVDWYLAPIFAIENPDNLCIFSAVEELIDAFETIITNNRDTFELNADAKLIAIGYSPENERIIKDENGNEIPNPARLLEDELVLRAKMLYVNGEGEAKGDFKWLIKDINDTASENHKKTLIELIFLIACVPNISDVGFTNAENSSALEKKFFSLEQNIILAEKLFKKEYLAMFENIVDRINLKNSTNFDFSEIQITFKRNLPTNKKELIDMALSLREVLSEESVIGMLPLDIDTETELAKKKEEQETNMDKFMRGQNVGEDKQGTEEAPNELQEEPTNNER